MREVKTDPGNGVRLTRAGLPDKRFGATPTNKPPRSKAGRMTKKTMSVKAMVEGALDELGGQKWLVKQAERFPQKFMELLARVMPHQLQTEHTEFTYVIQKISVDTGPVPGVISTGLPEVERLQ